MRIGVEASAIFRARKDGVGYYSHDLILALAREMPEDEFLLCYISFITKKPRRLSPSPANFKYRRVSLIPGKIYNFLDHYLIGLPIDVLARAKADVFFFPNFFRWPLWLCRKSVIVIHDLGFLEAPDHIVERHRKYLSRRVPQSIKQATHVVAVSEYTKQRLIFHYGISPSKVTVVSPAVDHKKYIPADTEAIAEMKQKYGITKKYLLFLGTIEPRKNVAGIIRAYSQLPQEQRDEYQLVLAGGKGWLDEEIFSLLGEIPEGFVVQTGYVADNDKAALYSGATLFVYPSHYEGWGMPVLEAMACGTPVITARNSSLPEVGGDAAAFVETAEPAELAKLISELLGDPNRLKTMRAQGLERAQESSWEASARILAQLLRSLRS